MALNQNQIRGLLRATQETHDVEIDCDEFLARMAALVEARVEGRPIAESLKLAEAHERLCANCREESLALRDAIAASGH